MSGRRLILHIGTHKTGSTSFQKCLLRNSAALNGRSVRALREKNLHHPSGNPVPRCNLAGFAQLLLRDEVRSIARLKGRQETLPAAQRRRRLDRLADRVAGLEAETVIMSAEGLCFLRDPLEQAALRRFVERTGRRVTTLVVFRQEADWRASWSDQIAKALRDGPATLADQYGPGGVLDDWYYDKDAIRAFWAPFALHEIDYAAQDNVIIALFAACGVDMTGLNLEFRFNVRS